MDVDGIKKLIVLMNDNDLCELEVEEEGRKVRLRKHEHHPAPTGMMMQMPGAPVRMEQAAAAAPAAAPKAARTDVFEVKSPLVGTFYRSAKPGSPSFCDVNDRVGADKTLCIIEAMKVMNEIKAEIEGVIEAVLVNNGEPVEFNQPLFLIRKEG